MGLVIIAMLIKPLFAVGTIQLPTIDITEQSNYRSFDYKEFYVAKLEERVKNDLGIKNIKIYVNSQQPNEIIYVRATEKADEIAKLLGITSDKVGD
jgi:hypothetical protein